jgi:hypothetical protein
MSLESKAKTTVQIRYETGANAIWNAKEWVPLEEAQKLEGKIQDLEIWNKKLEGKLALEPYALANQLVKMTNKAIEAENKIAEANKILDEINSPLTLDFIRIDRLREVLNK